MRDSGSLLLPQPSMDGCHRRILVECGGWTPLWIIRMFGYGVVSPKHPKIQTSKAVSSHRTPKSVSLSKDRRSANLSTRVKTLAWMSPGQTVKCVPREKPFQGCHHEKPRERPR